MIFAVWWVPLAAYLTKMGMSATHKALILSSMAIGCLMSPVVGMLSDRFFQGQYVLGLSNILTAILLLFSGMTDSPTMLFIYLMLAMIFYMPSWGLTSSIAMTHLPQNSFARVRVFGSIGWVLSGGFSLVFMHLLNINFDGTRYPFFCAAGVALISGIYCLTLPKTPALSKGKPVSFLDIFGLKSVRLMKEKNFFWFIIFSFLSMIPFAMYFSYGSEFLLDQGFKFISITMNFGQLFEMALLLTIPFIVKRYGLRTTMILGLIALLLRYISFWGGEAVNINALYILGILIHGLIFGYFYLGGQMYIDQKASKELKAEAQGFIFLVTFGLGLILGNFINGQIIEAFSHTTESEIIYDWNMIWGSTTAFSLLLIFLFVLLFKKEEAKSLTTEAAVSAA